MMASMNVVTVVFVAYGHENVLSTHKTTFEVTKEDTLTKHGDCIVAVKSTKCATDFPVNFKEAARKEGSRITITFEADEMKETITAEGNPQLQFTHKTDFVVRKSDYVCGRTLAINANKAAIDFSRDLVKKLRDPKQEVRITLVVENY